MPSEPPDACLEPDEILSFVAGGGSDAERIAVEEHIDECGMCRALLSAAADESADGEAIVDLIGVELGRYTIRDRLGSGGQGVLYLAEDKQLGRRVVIKLVRAELEGRGSATERLLHEAKAMAKLSHPNVVQIYDIGTFDESVYLAMEYLDGGDLEAWLETESPTRDEIIDIFVKAASGLAAAHRAGLVHRDFKPANVVVASDGRVKVTDFGLAAADEAIVGTKAAPSHIEAPLLTRPGVTPGTPAFMSPEQAVGGEIDERSDQYSFCVALFRALEGRWPIELDSKTENKPSEWQVRPASTSVPARLRRALARGLSMTPGERFDDMDQLAKALTRRSRLWQAAIAVAVATVAMLAMMLYLRSGETTPRDPCNDAGAELAAEWNAQRRANTGFAGSGKLASRLENIVAELVAAERNLCESQARDLAAAAVTATSKTPACLRRRMDEFFATTSVLTAEKPNEAAALRLVAQLAAVRVCQEPGPRSHEPMAIPEGQMAAVIELRLNIARRDAGTSMAKAEAAIEATQLVAAAEAINYAPLRARALMHAASVGGARDGRQTADQILRDAVGFAVAGHAIFLRARAELVLVENAQVRGDEQAFQVLAAQVRRTLARLGTHRDDDPILKAALSRVPLTAARGGELCPAADGLAAHLQFDSIEGTRVVDSSGNANHGELTPVRARSLVGGVRRHAADLTGADRRVNLGSSQSLDDLEAMTVCAWVRPSRFLGQYPAIADKSLDTYEGGWNFYIRAPGSLGFLSNRRHWVEGKQVEVDRWQHACASWDGSGGADGIRLYLDGNRLDVGESGSNGTEHDSDADKDLILGLVNNGEQPFDGLVDEFRLYRRVLSPAEVLELFDCSLIDGEG